MRVGELTGEQKAADRVVETSSNAVARALAGIRDLVLQRELLPGEQIRQGDMAERLSLSRVPVREALKALEMEGVVRHSPNQGYFVTKFSASDLRQVYLMREFLEGELFNSIEWPDEKQLSVVRALNDQLIEAGRQEDIQRMIEFNRLFHFAIFEMSPLTLVCNEVRRLWSMSDAYRALYLFDSAARERVVQEHSEILKALADRDLDRMLEVTSRHRDGSKRLVATMLGG
jgi:DNA-binding GntR family transcriptional regulator